MPIMDGYETTRLLRLRDKWKDLPGIAMTANALVEEREKALAAGMNDYIAKPIDCDEFLIKIAKMVTATHPYKPNTEEKTAFNSNTSTERPGQTADHDKAGEKGQMDCITFNRQLTCLQE